MGCVVTLVAVSTVVPLESSESWNPITAWRALRNTATNPIIWVLSPESSYQAQAAATGLATAAVGGVWTVAFGGGPRALLNGLVNRALMSGTHGHMTGALPGNYSGGAGTTALPQPVMKPCADQNLLPPLTSMEHAASYSNSYYSHMHAPAQSVSVHPCPRQQQQPIIIHLTERQNAMASYVPNGYDMTNLLRTVAGSCSPLTVRRIAGALSRSTSGVRESWPSERGAQPPVARMLEFG